jgi:hypothetical protein
MAEGIEELLRHPGIWRPGDARAPRAGTLSSGIPALDEFLPGRGWHPGAVTEIHALGEGIGELGLLMPVLAEVSTAGRWIVWIAPPHMPYAPTCADRGVDLSRMLVVRGADPGERLWAAEQVLRAPACGAVMLWEGAARFTIRSLRRLQLAAEAGGGLGVVFRNPRTGAAPSPAMMKLRIEPDPEGLAVTLLKCRGGSPGKRVVIEDAALNEVHSRSALARDSLDQALGDT